MPQIFPRSLDRRLRSGALAGLAGLILAVGGGGYFASPQFTDVGYQPNQPIPFSHRLHAGDVNIDCRYCHYAVEQSAVAGVPPVSVCLGCHQVAGTSHPGFVLLRDFVESGQAWFWIRVHKLPDYTYFHHARHIQAGLECRACHGEVEKMKQVRQVAPLSMRWCLECHRNPPAGIQFQHPERAADCTLCHR